MLVSQITNEFYSIRNFLNRLKVALIEKKDFPIPGWLFDLLGTDVKTYYISYMRDISQFTISVFFISFVFYEQEGDCCVNIRNNFNFKEIVHSFLCLIGKHSIVSIGGAIYCYYCNEYLGEDELSICKHSHTSIVSKHWSDHKICDECGAELK